MAEKKAVETATKKADAVETAPAKTQLEKEREVASLEAKVKKADAILAPTVEETVEQDTSDIEVNDPQVLRPKDLPLVIKSKSGKWKNEEQAEYARYLNAYAYKNPEKFATKKKALIEKLAEIGENGSTIYKYKGNEGKLSFKNKLIEN